jgi:phage-related minor tail protein
LATTFDESTGEITQAANAVSKQLGITFDDALGKLEESFVAGSNLNGELLESAKEYSAFFAEAGLGANALFQTIQNGTQNGIFNDKAIDSVKEVTLRLREMPKATAAALEGIGLASEDITRLIETEGIGSAIATVSERLGELKADSPEVGRAIADIFGGPGEDAGLQYLISCGPYQT